jgi:hypothetical protein
MPPAIEAGGICFLRSLCATLCPLCLCVEKKYLTKTAVFFNTETRSPQRLVRFLFGGMRQIF